MILEIPDSLQKYRDEILAGVAAARLRNIELVNAWGYPARQPVIDPLHFAEELSKVKPNETYSGRAADLRAVKIWPLVGISAGRHNEGGAWRAWTLAKSLDINGRGAIPLDDLQALASELRIHPKTWRRWLAGARRLTLIRDRSRGDGWVVLASQPWAAVILGCEYAGTRPASIAAGNLVGKGWHTYIWAAYEQTHQGRPISRAKQENITGVPISTQRWYDNQAGVNRKPNYALSDRPADELAGVSEFEGRPAPFKFYDKRQRRAVVAWRLPDSRTASAANSLQRGRSRKINKAIKQISIKRINGLSILGQAPSYAAGEMPTLRLFHRTDRQAKATERKLAHSDLQQPSEIYLHTHEGYKADFWRVLPQLRGLTI